MSSRKALFSAVSYDRNGPNVGIFFGNFMPLPLPFPSREDTSSKVIMPTRRVGGLGASGAASGSSSSCSNCPSSSTTKPSSKNTTTTVRDGPSLLLPLPLLPFPGLSPAPRRSWLSLRFPMMDSIASGAAAACAAGASATSPPSSAPAPSKYAVMACCTSPLAEAKCSSAASLEAPVMLINISTSCGEADMVDGLAKKSQMAGFLPRLL
mmetsp:Transcript_99635/g.197530  ORF Transcript_99635/g.197530 Transcript_99635/m.197530 type:complete len:209 (-) Transcript_99635:14-640(-)